VFARRAVIDGRDVVQGAWLDWPELRAWLLSRIGDLLPAATLEPVIRNGETTSVEAARRLAFLPAQLVPGPVTIAGGTLASPLRISIAIAWVGAAVGFVALALLLRGTIRLSERRGAFVSAVTHELRTPLTTFRMYTEMLASGMVRDEAKRQGYVNTLHQESARLSHLVENVLSYARLERGRAAARVEDTTPGELLGRIEERLRQRAQQGGLTVSIELPDGTADIPLRVDTTAVEQVLFNLVDNATKYGRRGDGGGEIRIRVEAPSSKRLAIRVTDQGPGLTPAARKRIFQPFSKSATEAAHSQPGVGLGLALCRRLARDELHGDLVLERSGADGTVFRLELRAK
jgi:signal transduction histidine kinase